METTLIFVKAHVSGDNICYYECENKRTPVIGTFYLREWKFKELGEPDKLRVSIEKVEE